jgi:ATP-dependent DNA ligase
LEYQGPQHYKDYPGSGFLNLIERQKRDIEKKMICIANGITLVWIPHWWDETVESLSSTLNQYLPGIFLKKFDSPPIPTEMPTDYKDNRRPHPRKNKNMMHGYDYEASNEINVQGWFMSEKLDGMRAYWDGNQFWSKNANVINVPESFKALPPFPLDGELWGGYEESDLTIYLLKQNCGKKKINIDWTKIKFCVFDAPHVVATYDKRHLFLQNNFSQYCNSNISLIPMQTCDGKDHLERYLREMINKGGEGIVIHHPDLLYQPGRTQNLLKVKKTL